MRHHYLLLMLIALSALNLNAWAAPSVDEIINRTNKVAYYEGKDGRA